ncbi:MAG TPA: hypothetical protein VIC60_04195, partial [Thermomicrobiales bacterium]
MRLGIVGCTLLGLVAIALTTVGPSNHVAGAGTSVLLVTDSTNAGDPFGPYLGEILRAEGFPTFGTTDIASVTSSSLAPYAVVILGPATAVSAPLVTTFTTYVQGGGRLIAMHPPASLAALFGVSSAGTTTNEGYIAINGGGLAAGFTTTPLQVHASADNYNLAGATKLASLNSSFTTAT